MKLHCPHCYIPLSVEGSLKKGVLMDFSEVNALFTDIGKCRLLKFESHQEGDEGVVSSSFECALCNKRFVLTESYDGSILKVA